MGLSFELGAISMELITEVVTESTERGHRGHGVSHRSILTTDYSDRHGLPEFGLSVLIRVIRG